VRKKATFLLISNRNLNEKHKLTVIFLIIAEPHQSRTYNYQNYCIFRSFSSKLMLIFIKKIKVSVGHLDTILCSVDRKCAGRSISNYATYRFFVAPLCCIILDKNKPLLHLFLYTKIAQVITFCNLTNLG